MRHRVQGKKLGRNAAQRSALYRGLLTSLFKHGRVITTLPKAKALRPMAERLVTRTKAIDLNSRRLLLKTLYEKESVENALNIYVPSVSNRDGGYTRIVKLGHRSSDKAEMARIEFVENSTKPAKKTKKTKVAEEVIVAEPVIEATEVTESVETPEVSVEEVSDSISETTEESKDSKGENNE